MIVVSNATPLIALAKLQHADLLRILLGDIYTAHGHKLRFCREAFCQRISNE